MSKSAPGSAESSPRRLRRRPSSEQIDYEALGETGERVYKERYCVHRATSNTTLTSSSTAEQSSALGSPARGSHTNTVETDEFQLQPSSLEKTVQHFLNTSIMDEDDDTVHDRLNSPTSNQDDEETQKVPIAVHTGHNEVEEEHEQLVLLEEDFSDYLDEHRLEQMTMNTEDLNEYISRMEEYRKLYRTIDKSIKKKIKEEIYNQNYYNVFDYSLKLIKKCILQAIEKKSAMREESVQEELNKRDAKANERLTSTTQMKDAAEFLIWEASRMIKELNDEFSKIDNVDDDELLRRKEDHAEIGHQLERLSNKIQQVYQLKTGTINERSINDLRTRYNALLIQRVKYETHLNENMKERELLKEKVFQSTASTIPLGKFKGYDSENDIYTFQTEFEKLYLPLTPKKRLPDVLKNKHLEDPALALVKSQDDIDEIWERLKKAFGDKNVLLQNNLSDINKSSALLKSRNPEQLQQGLMKLINTMTDLMNLAEKHNIEVKLYNSDGTNKIYSLMGDNRLTRWLTSISDVDIEGKELWKRLIKFLEKELKVVQEKALLNIATSKNNPQHENEQKEKKKSNTYLANDNNNHNHDGTSNGNPKCPFCDEYGHAATNGPRGRKIIQYFSCPKFVSLPIHQKFQEMRSKNFCHQCLYPGASQDEGKHKDGSCQKDFICKHPSHSTFQRKKHVLVCSEHCETEENKKLFEEYKSRFIMRNKCPLSDFSKEMKLSFYVYKTEEQNSKEEEDEISDKDKEEEAIFGLQVIEVDKQRYTLFYDSGCSKVVTEHNAVTRLGDRATQVTKGPTKLGGVGDIKVISKHGEYRIKIPMYNGKVASMRGICLDNITHEMPAFPLNEVNNDIEHEYVKQGGKKKDLPRLPKSIGGWTVHIMIGSQYLAYSPDQFFKLPSGLTIYKSMFKNADGGGRGVVAGPHPIFTAITKQYANSAQVFFSEQYQLYRAGYQTNPDKNFLSALVETESVPLFSSEWEGSTHTNDAVDAYPQDDDFHVKEKYETDDNYPDSYQVHYTTQQQIRLFDIAENAGSTIDYRCKDCRVCVNCKNNERTEMESIKNESEQEQIVESVSLNFETNRVEATLPFTENPLTELAPNKEIAHKVYRKVVKRLNNSEQDKKDIVAAEEKLQKLGYVDYVRNLTAEQQEMLKNSPIQNYIPWFGVWNSNSMTTKCRPVFHASMATATGKAINNILAKGTNNLKSLVEIMIRLTMHPVVMHTDIKQMYNRIMLKEEYWCFQRYLWSEGLNPSKDPEEKVILSIIYGMVSSGNQAEYALRMIAELSKDTHPEAYRIIHNDLYADDCITGADSLKSAMKYANELEESLEKGEFHLKGFTYSGQVPNKELSADEKSIVLAGTLYFPEDDELQLNIKPLNFAKKVNGKKDKSKKHYEIPENLNRRHCCSKVGEIFDLRGLVAPITAKFKIDMHQLVTRPLNWDDVLPPELRTIWCSNFELMEELKNVRFKRAIIPSDAVNLEINTIDTADASKSIACAAIYARFKRKNGRYSCQLVFARTKLLPEDNNQPRGELVAQVLSVHTGELVRRSFGKYHVKAVKLTDSQIVAHWLNNIDLRLNIFVRNRVIECCRYINPKLIKYVKSADMIADIGTRGCSDIRDVGPGSIWQNGFGWMEEDESKFPTKDINQIKLDCQEKQAVNEEMIALRKKITSFEWPQTAHSTYVAYRCGQIVPSDVQNRYEYSKYIIDPNKRRYQTAIRLMSYVILFVKKFIQKWRPVVQERKEIEMNLNGENEPTQTNKKQTDSADEINTTKLNAENDDIASNINIQEVNLKDPDVILTEELIKAGANYYNWKATNEIKHFLKDDKMIERISTERDSILYHSERPMPKHENDQIVQLTEVMRDLSSCTFVVPLIDKHSPIAYSIINEVHWNDPVASHSGVETVLRYTMKYAYIIEGRELVRKIRKGCERCRYLAKRTIEVGMGPVSAHRLTIAPPFYITQVDLAGPFKAYSSHNKRCTIKIYLAVFCCSTTSTVSIRTLEDYGTESFIKAYIRLSSEVGYPKMLLIDEGSQLVKACKTMEFNFHDVKNKLYINHSTEFEVCPVGGHNMHGRVERKIKQIKESLEKTIANERLSVLGWETVGAEISNCINDLPIGLHSYSTDLENLDLLTPNRLRLGRNNERSPVGPMLVTTKPEKFIETNRTLFNAWFENWLISYVPNLVHQPKWFKTDYDLQKGDLVLFLKEEGSLVGSYQFGLVEDVEIGKDNKIRTVNVKYHNHNENISRTTRRAVRELVMIHAVDELNIMEELGAISTYADMKYKTNNSNVSLNARGGV